MIPACGGETVGQTVGQTESIMAKTALCVASCADALSKNVLCTCQFGVKWGKKIGDTLTGFRPQG